MTMKVSCIQKTFSPPTKILEIPPAMVVFVEAYLISISVEACLYAKHLTCCFESL